jgi:hydrogenase/urease accessory protein HupE
VHPSIRVRSLLLIVLTLGAWLPAAAHPLSVSYSRFAVSNRQVDAVVRVPMDDMDLLFRLDADLSGTVDAAEVERAHDTLAKYLAEHVALTVNGARLSPTPGTIGIWKDDDQVPYVEMTARYEASVVIHELDARVDVLAHLYADHRNLAEFVFDGSSEQFVFQHGNSHLVRPNPSHWATAWSFLLLGLEHIILGYDHVLFLFGLLLVGRDFRSLVAIVTSFTAAHSLTLSLATLGVIEPAAWTIEAAIALSIAYVGLENLFATSLRHRWKLTFFFGLVHGFGFANILREMHLPRSGLLVSLFSFNLGVELGQIAIVAAMWPALSALARSPRRLLVTRVASVVIVALGLYWFIERVS